MALNSNIQREMSQPVIGEILLAIELRLGPGNRFNIIGGGENVTIDGELYRYVPFQFKRTMDKVNSPKTLIVLENVTASLSVLARRYANQPFEMEIADVLMADDKPEIISRHSIRAQRIHGKGNKFTIELGYGALFGRNWTSATYDPENAPSFF